MLEGQGNDGDRTRMTSDYISAILDFHLETPNPEHAKTLIKYFHERLQESREVDEQLHHDDAFLLEKYMAHVFAQIRAGVPADQALGQKLGRGKHIREDTTWRDLSLAAFAVLQMRNGKTWEVATGEAADAFNVSESTARRAYSEHEHATNWLSDDELEVLIGSMLSLSP